MKNPYLYVGLSIIIEKTFKQHNLTPIVISKEPVKQVHLYNTFNNY